MLERSRWWAELPSAQDWLSFQRDAGIAPAEQQDQSPVARNAVLRDAPWLRQSESAAGLASELERPLMALAVLCLLAPGLWFGLRLYQVQENIDRLTTQQAQLQAQASPIMEARSQALDHLARIQALQALERGPAPLALMTRVAEVITDKALNLKEWNFAGQQLTITLSASTELASTPVIDKLQQAGPFSDVKALPGRDPKTAVFQMKVQGQ
jgi:Tfp pilus assembly protein PilN